MVKLSLCNVLETVCQGHDAVRLPFRVTDKEAVVARFKEPLDDLPQSDVGRAGVDPLSTA